tara:strand:- start:350 stop:784 length:435 start_codon:yes stop_codon:yes gene_type:complete
MNYLGGMSGAMGGGIGNVGALPGAKEGKEVADLFRKMQQQPQTPTFMPGMGAAPGGFLGGMVGNPQGMIDGQNLAFNPVEAVSKVGEKIGEQFQNFLNRPVMVDPLVPNPYKEGQMIDKNFLKRLQSPGNQDMLMEYLNRDIQR